jgi:hypothetical protein
MVEQVNILSINLQQKLPPKNALSSKYEQTQTLNWQWWKPFLEMSRISV